MRITRGLFLAFLPACVAIAIAAGCGGDAESDPAPAPDAGFDVELLDASAPDTAKDTAKRTRARATILATSLADAGNVNGTVDFEDLGNGSIAVAISISGAREGQHGLHIHENSKCDDTDAGAAGAAGGHWNPADAGHGFPESPSHHPGDLGNIDIPFSGVGSKTLTVSGFSIVKGEANSAIGRTVIFHAGADDGMTQPTGNSGGRAGCGVIEER